MNSIKEHPKAAKVALINCGLILTRLANMPLSLLGAWGVITFGWGPAVLLYLAFSMMWFGWRDGFEWGVIITALDAVKLAFTVALLSQIEWSFWPLAIVLYVLNSSGSLALILDGINRDPMVRELLNG